MRVRETNLSKSLILKWLAFAGLLLGIFSSISLAEETTAYYIRTGDTFSSIATAHGISLEELLQLNPEISDPNNLIVGTAIQVPLPTKEEEGAANSQCLQPYTVSNGDTWDSIAIANGIEAAILALVNNMMLADDLIVGSLLCIPDSIPEQDDEEAGMSDFSFPLECAGSVWFYDDYENEQLYEEPDIFAASTPLPWGSLACQIATKTLSLVDWVQVLVEDGQSGWVQEQDLFSEEEYLERVEARLKDIAEQIKDLQITLDRLIRTRLGSNVGPTESVALELVLTLGPTPTATAGAGEYTERLEVLVVSPQLQGYLYDRDDWRHWVDSDGDCQNTRAEVLIEESLTPVTFRANNPCTVHSGLWVGPWGGQQHTLAGDLDIDHHVPLFNAHLSGGATWSASKKQAYANDLALAFALQATKASYNRQKGARGPEEWRPPLRETWCVYAQDWVDVKYTYSLTVTSLEKGALEDMLSTCEDGSKDSTVTPEPQEPIEPEPPQKQSPAQASNLPIPGVGEGSWYIIVSGDSLGKIASSQGCESLVLIAVNQISNPSVINVGSRLWIPANCATLVSLATTQVLPTPTAVAPLLTPTPLPTENTAAAPSAGASTPTPIPPPPTATPTALPPAPTSTPAPIPPTPTSTPVAQLPVTSQTGYQCTVDPYQPPPKPANAHKGCNHFSSRAEFDQYFGGSFYPSHDRDKDCIPCESLN